MSSKYSPGQLAKSLIRGVGDADVAVAGAEARPEVVDKIRDYDLGQVREAYSATASRVLARIEELRRDLRSAEEQWEKRYEKVRAKVEQAKMWRDTGVQERIPNLPMPLPVRFAVLLVLAFLDFYIFAQAYGVAEDLEPGSARWWQGGLLGLVVFVVGLGMSHQYKAVIVARAQRELLREADAGALVIDEAVRRRLVTMRPSPLILYSSTAVFSLLLLGGMFIRLQGAGDENLAAVVFQSLIPLAAVITELYLHDPIERMAPRRTRKEKKLLKEIAKLEEKLRGIREKEEFAALRVEKQYAIEQSILNVEQLDMGLAHRERTQ
jgi:hypothetical protein